jgi:Trk K+ transport system NAD-binding subunit
MGHVFYLLLRRLRAPIIVIIVVYAISIVGFVLIPGVDDEGNPWRMDFFHAFYFVSYMGTTIGFGEIPYAFTVAQRAWATATIYATVISWLYSIGKIFALFQDPSLTRLLAQNTFARKVRMLHEPFYLVCGYGFTGKRLVQRLDAHGIKTVVIDSNQQVIDELEAHELGLAVPGLCGDASDPDILNRAGIQRRNCIGVVALTNHDHTNLCVAINSKLVDPERSVISRSQSLETTANLESFGTDYIIDPFETYADYLVKSLTEPYKHIISDLVFNPHHKVWASPHQNTEGRWVVCGYGRFGRAIEKKFREYNIPITFIEANPGQRDVPRGTVLGVGTEAVTLQQADIETATGIVAGTGDDADNLSIIITARQIKEDIITVARQNLAANKPVFRAAKVNMIMEPVRIIADEIFIQIKTPMLMEFLSLLREKDSEWARELLLRISDVIQDQPLNAWAHRITPVDCPAVDYSLANAAPVELGHLCRDPRARDDQLPTLALLLKRGDEKILLPEPHTRLQAGDEILFCGQDHSQMYMSWITRNDNVLRYICTGVEAPGGLLWRWLATRRHQKSPADSRA